MFSGKCVLCKGKKSSKDPHSVCPDCVSPCSLSFRCPDCESISTAEFTTYLRVLKKRFTQRATRARMSQVELEIHADNEGRISPDPTMGVSSSSEAVCTVQAPQGIVATSMSTPQTSTTVVASGLSSVTSTMVSATFAPTIIPAVSTAPFYQAPQTLQAPPQQAPAPVPWQGAWTNTPPSWQGPPPSFQAPRQPAFPQWPTSPYGFPPYGFPYGWPPQTPQAPPAPAPAPQAPAATVSVPPSSRKAPDFSVPGSSDSSRRDRSSTSSRDRSRSPLRVKSSKEQPEEEEEETLGYDEVVDWVADNLGSLCPSPGAESSPRKALKYEPFTQLPLHPVAWDIVDSLNEEFKKLSLDGSFKATANMKRRYPVHSVEFLDASARVDDDIKYVTGASASGSSRYKVSDAKVASFEVESKKTIRMVSALASAAEAIGNNLDSEDRNVQHVQTTINWMMRGFTDVVVNLRHIWAGALAMRRSGFLSLSSWDESTKKKLLRQPVDRELLFNGVIEGEHKRLGELAQAQVALRAIKSFQGRANPPKKGSYRGRRNRAFHARGGSSNQPHSRYISKGGSSDAGTSGKKDGRK